MKKIACVIILWLSFFVRLNAVAQEKIKLQDSIHKLNDSINKLNQVILELRLRDSIYSATGINADTSIITLKPPKDPKEIIIMYGLASFYAKKFDGRKTATGDRFHSGNMTAACNVLPLGTWVKVTNVKNDNSVIVQINDRLHPKNKRLIDLTKNAAEQLDFISSGITKVKVEVLGKLYNKQRRKRHTK